MKKTTKATLPTREMKPGSMAPASRVVAAEVPIALAYNGMSHVVLMATPANLKELAIGFTLSEEIIETLSELKGFEIFEADQGLIAKIEIPKVRLEALIGRPRNLVGQTGCGLCGVEEIENAVRAYPPIKTRPKADKASIFKALESLRDHQPINRETGAVHAAAFVGPNGIEAAFEDVGRHNAFDKLIGHMALNNKSFEEGFVLLTSRCSFELVQKALAVKAPMLVTISAPTDLAVKLAEDHDLTLIALARSDAVLVMNDPFGIF